MLSWSDDLVQVLFRSPHMLSDRVVKHLGTALAGVAAVLFSSHLYFIEGQGERVPI